MAEGEGFEPPERLLREQGARQAHNLKVVPPMVEQLTLNQLVEGSDKAVVTRENDDCVVPDL